MNKDSLSKKEYEKIHRIYEENGLSILDGAEVYPTDWAFENGVFNEYEIKNDKFVKISNQRNGRNILVIKIGNKQPHSYWAGFWKNLSSQSNQ